VNKPDILIFKFDVQIASETFTPKGTVHSASFSLSDLIFRFSLGSACQPAIIALHNFSGTLAELVVAVGSIDLVVGELDR
jgi:NADH:ubiquinone oxidoreductase subunit D